MVAEVPRDIANAIVDPKAYADGRRIDEALHWLRCHAPLAWVEPDHYRPFWVVARHGDIQEVERHNDTFHNGDTFVTLTGIAEGNSIRTITGGSPHLVRGLVHMDGEDHFNHRRLTQPWFMPQNMHRLEARIRQIARQHVERMAACGGHCDFAEDVAVHYPLAIILELIGIPAADAPLILRLIQELFGRFDAEMMRNRAQAGTEGASIAGLQATVAEFMAYFVKLSEARRKRPRNDLASLLATASIDDQPLGQLEMLSYYIIIASCAGHSTAHTIAGGLWALLDHPGQMASLLTEAAPIEGMIEESMRWVTPVKHFMRSAAADAEIAGVKIAKGDWLMLSYPSGNRDDDVFAAPFSFNITRSPNRHLAFGYGAHLCLGRHLGRLEMRIFWEELLPRLKTIEWDGVPSNVEANFVCGPKSVPVRFTLQ
ncbi:MAG: cytochrome P450 [Rhizomicrobium sp.]